MLLPWLSAAALALPRGGAAPRWLVAACCSVVALQQRDAFLVGAARAVALQLLAALLFRAALAAATLLHEVRPRA
jgi:hypothetical protein